jgi:hypothetical protein
MAKIVLGKRPANFKKTVTFTDLDGTEGALEALYKYRTVREFGAFIDEWAKEAEQKMEAEKAAREAKRREAKERGEEYVEPILTNEEIRANQAAANADYLMHILEGWNLDVPFSAEAVLQLCDEMPAAASQLIHDYRLAITEGRLGN